MARKSVIAGGGILGALIGLVVVIMVVARAFPVLWPVAANTSEIDAMSGTDAGTTTFQSIWPIVLIIGGIGIAVMAIMWIVRKTHLSGGGL